MFLLSLKKKFFRQGLLNCILFLCCIIESKLSLVSHTAPMAETTLTGVQTVDASSIGCEQMESRDHVPDLSKDFLKVFGAYKSKPHISQWEDEKNRQVENVSLRGMVHAVGTDMLPDNTSTQFTSRRKGGHKMSAGRTIASPAMNETAHLPEEVSLAGGAATPPPFKLDLTPLEKLKNKEPEPIKRKGPSPTPKEPTVRRKKSVQQRNAEAKLGKGKFHRMHQSLARMQTAPQGPADTNLIQQEYFDQTMPATQVSGHIDQTNGEVSGPETTPENIASLSQPTPTDSNGPSGQIQLQVSPLIREQLKANSKYRLRMRRDYQLDDSVASEDTDLYLTHLNFLAEGRTPSVGGSSMVSGKSTKKQEQHDSSRDCDVSSITTMDYWGSRRPNYLPMQFPWATPSRDVEHGERQDDVYRLWRMRLLTVSVLCIFVIAVSQAPTTNRPHRYVEEPSLAYVPHQMIWPGFHDEMSYRPKQVIPTSSKTRARSVTNASALKSSAHQNRQNPEVYFQNHRTPQVDHPPQNTNGNGPRDSKRIKHDVPSPPSPNTPDAFSKIAREIEAASLDLRQETLASRNGFVPRSSRATFHAFPSSWESNDIGARMPTLKTRDSPDAPGAAVGLIGPLVRKIANFLHWIISGLPRMVQGADTFLYLET